jgi:hypothetical protein
VQEEESGAAQEDHRDQQQAGVRPARGRLADHHPEDHVDPRHGEDQPEVADLVLPFDVDAGIGQQQP